MTVEVDGATFEDVTGQENCMATVMYYPDQPTEVTTGIIGFSSETGDRGVAALVLTPDQADEYAAALTAAATKARKAEVTA